VVNTIVARHEQLHRTELSGSLTAARPSVRGSVLGIQQYLSAQGGSSSTTALQRSYGLLNQTLNGQARLWSYVDDFRYMALACFACVPIVFTLKKAVAKKGAAPAAH
jgi:DHA2 family multidrug resistance protein